MLVFPEIDPVIFSIGPLKIRWYGMMYVIGFLIAWWLARIRARRPDTPVDVGQVDDLIFYAMLGVIIGGRLGYCLVYGWDELISDPLYIFRITEGGMAFHGGLVGVMVAMWLYARSLGKTIWHLTDFVTPIVPPGLFFGRVGQMRDSCRYDITSRECRLDALLECLLRIGQFKRRLKLAVR